MITDDQSIRINNLIIDFAEKYRKGGCVTGDLADTTYLIYSIINPDEEFSYCNRVFKDGIIRM